MIRRLPHTLYALMIVAGCHRDAGAPRRGAETSRAPEAAVVATGHAPPTPMLTPIPADHVVAASDASLPAPPPPTPEAPAQPLDAETTRIVTQARAASRRRDFRAACELVERARRHAPQHPEVRRAARAIAREIEEAYAFTRTGRDFYHVVMVCVRQGVPVDLEIFS